MDGFRRFHPNQTDAYTCWNTQKGARLTNFGTRIDYIFVDSKLANESLLRCDHLTNYPGSDHCPVVAEFDLEIIQSTVLPQLCTKWMPEFRGTQQKLLNFVVRQEKRTILQTEIGVNCKKAKKATAVTLDRFFEKKTCQKLSKSEWMEDESLSQNSSEESSSKKEFASNSDEKSAENGNAWKKLFPGPKRAPACAGHKEACVLRTVKKPGPNLNRRFYVCGRPEGRKDDPNARCNHFQWE